MRVTILKTGINPGPVRVWQEQYVLDEIALPCLVPVGPKRGEGSNSKHCFSAKLEYLHSMFHHE